MAVLDIVTYPTKSLTEPSVPVEEIDDSIKKLAEDMLETMYKAPGVGLAAPQVGVNKRLIVCVVPPEETDEIEDAEEEELDPADREHLVLINPVVVSKKGQFVFEDEGCLSLPEFRADVKRAEFVVVEATNLEGDEITIETGGLFGVILQHEIDHLDGVLFIDRISALKRELYKKRIKKQMRA